MKQKKVVKQPVPYMNSKLRKACFHKAMSRNKYFKHGRSSQSWELYRKSRNNVTKFKAVSMNTYFIKDAILIHLEIILVNIGEL